MTAADSPAAPADRTLVTTRTFDAPRELVWKAWTDPKQLAQWFPPDHFTASCEIDVRPGGRVRIDMKGPDGSVFPTNGVYREIVPNERIVFTLEGAEGGIPPEVLTTVLFEDQAGKTRLTIRQTMATAAAFDSMRAPMSQGLQQTLDKLAAHLGRPTGTTVMVAGRALSLTRIFDAPRELVYMAYTDPTHIVKWMFSNDWESPFAETDVRPGGVFRIGMRPADRSHEGFVFDGTYREVVPNERVVQVIGDGRVMTATFEDFGGKTRLTLAVQMAMNADQEQTGYTQILEHFAQHLATLKR